MRMHFEQKNRLQEFAVHYGQCIVGWHVENTSGALLDSPELNRMLSDMGSGDVILIEQVDRLSRSCGSDGDIPNDEYLKKTVDY